jgi:phage shock protein C
VFFNSPDLIK